MTSVPLILFLLCLTSVNSMTERQLQAAVKLVRNTCTSKTKIKAPEMEKMQKAQWDNLEYNSKCFLYCLMSMNQLITAENKMNYDYGVQLAEKQLPEARKAATLASAAECKDSAKTLDDGCIAAWEMTVCVYNSNPSNFFLFPQ